jgi:hypothetical protein
LGFCAFRLFLACIFLAFVDGVIRFQWSASARPVGSGATLCFFSLNLRRLENPCTRFGCVSTGKSEI